MATQRSCPCLALPVHALLADLRLHAQLPTMNVSKGAEGRRSVGARSAIRCPDLRAGPISQQCSPNSPAGMQPLKCVVSGALTGWLSGLRPQAKVVISPGLGSMSLMPSTHPAPGVISSCQDVIAALHWLQYDALFQCVPLGHLAEVSVHHALKSQLSMLAGKPL